MWTIYINVIFSADMEVLCRVDWVKNLSPSVFLSCDVEQACQFSALPQKPQHWA